MLGGRGEGEKGDINLRINVVDADEVVLHEDLALLGDGHGEVGQVLEDFGAAGLHDQDALHGLGDGCGHGGYCAWS